MKKPNKIFYGLGAIIVILCAILFFMWGSNTASNQQSSSPKTNQVSSSNNTTANQESGNNNPTKEPKKVDLNYEELAIAAYIQSLRGENVNDKLASFNNLVSGHSDNPQTEQPTSFKRHEDPAFEITTGDFGFAWWIISFEGDNIKVTHFVHSQQDFDKTYTKAELINQYGSHKQELDNAIQQINENHQKVQQKLDNLNDD